MGIGAGRSERTARLVAAVSVGVVGLVIATSAVVPTQALDAGSPPAAEWTAPLAPTEDPDVLVPYAPRDVIEFGGTLFVADPDGIDRFDAATGSPLTSFPAPTNVTIADVVANTTGSLYAVGTLDDDGDPQIWVGRYTAAGVLDWSDSYGNPYVAPGGAGDFGSGDDAGEAIALDGSGGLYVGGILDRFGGFDRQVSVRKYSDVATPQSQWQDEYLVQESSSLEDIGASSTGVYVVGAWFGPFSSPYVLKISPSTGAQEVFEAGFSESSPGFSTGVAVTDTSVFVSVRERFNTAAGPASDARVVKFDAVTLDVIWSNMIGTTYGVLPELGSTDSATDVIVDGTTVYVTGTTDDPAINGPLAGLSGTGGFVRQLTDNGPSATVDFTYSTPPGGGLGTDGTSLYLTGSDGSGSGTCDVRLGENQEPGTCFLAKIIDTQSGAGGVWPDFDGDGLADRSVFRPEFGGWFANGQPTAFLGLPGDVPVPGDYNGDDITERAVFRNGAWYIDGQPTRFLGTATDVPVPGDYDGDGDWEPAVYRDGAWFIEGQPTRFLGAAGDVPVPGDYNGDGTTEIAVFRPSVGGWYVDGAAPVFYGLSTDVPVPGDYNGDGTTDRAVYRPEFGGWYVDGQPTEFIGLSSDVPVPADYNGDGTTERAVYRPEFGGWYVQNATTVFYGLGTDIPLPLPAAVYTTYY
jgi:hypothetical protein